MLPPILPSPTSPRCMCGGPSGVRSAWLRQEAARHQQVLEAGRLVRAARVERLHSREYDGLRRGRERQLDVLALQRGESVEQELRVEAGGEVVAGDDGFDR